MVSKPDFVSTIDILSRKMTTPTTQDWTVVKRIRRYLKGTA